MGLKKLLERKGKLVSWRRADRAGQPSSTATISPATTDVSAPQLSQDPPQGTHVGNLTTPYVVASQPVRDLNSLRDETWEMAYRKLRLEQEDVIEAYEHLIKDENCIDQTTELGPVVMADIVSKQEKKMSNEQWRYTLLGRKHTVRDDVETIFGVVQQTSGLISIGMSAAPPFVSLPWLAHRASPLRKTNTDSLTGA